ncbi:SIS domain-containing protein [Nocardia otitidiscaviarum]|uniref:PfkB family carbohydrate kinase n=1 Tax=Nocardia otitidiscaviarum TaxID=1823 RepID=UPI0009DF11D6|nr:PfkB family carbohydrate kinase [Nocardia otitidiscaviarum]MBF6137771.1 SIS domain-containing protein [Nocardia otitidiscaviarum]MBF6485292.1 SIS domain-containing protein [Nocardia otitidiscaviarum]
MGTEYEQPDPLPDRVAAVVAAFEGGQALDQVRLWGAHLADHFRHGARLLIVGNGGSAAQAQHLAAELVGRFEAERIPLPALALTADTATLTAVGNDYGYEQTFSRQIRAHARPGDVLLAISTSGASANVLAAAAAARDMGLMVWGLTGGPDSPLTRCCDAVVTVPVDSTATIQECHLLLVHEMCAALDSALTEATPASEVEPPITSSTRDKEVVLPSRGLPRRLVIVGDVLADCDVAGKVTGISPEAPVPILTSEEQRWRPGGAGRAAMLAAADGWEITLVAALGTDEHATRIRADLTAAGVTVAGLPTSGTTPVKMRLRAQERTLLRVDYTGPVAAVGDPTLRARKALMAADGVLVTDYGRGVAAQPRVRELIAAAATRVPVVWDPHRLGAEPVAGVRVVVPNQDEALALAPEPAPQTGLEADIRRGRILRSRWQAAYVAVKRGPEGAVLVGSDTEPAQTVSTPRREIHGDTCGAGDMLAVLLLKALMNRKVPATALHQAVTGATDYVGGHRVPRPKARRPRTVDALGLAERVRASGGTVVATGGCFDILHDGHRELLETARTLGDCLIVLLNSDASVTRLKGPGRPLVPVTQRAAMVAAFGCVDAVVVFDEDTPADALGVLRPDIWVKGGDYGHNEMPEQAVVEHHGGVVVLGPYQEGVSTSELIARAAAGRTVQP